MLMLTSLKIVCNLFTRVLQYRFHEEAFFCSVPNCVFERYPMDGENYYILIINHSKVTYFVCILGSSSSMSFDNSAEVVIQKADLENHNKEGGMWVVIRGKVFDLQEFKDQVR